MTHDAPPWLEYHWLDHTRLLLNSFRHFVGRELIPRLDSPEEQAEALFNAPRVVVSHTPAADPILNYANRAALQLWDIDIPTLLKTPSRHTAEPMHRDERAELLRRTTEHGYVDDYQGIRIAATGRRFSIEQAIVWNLIDEQGNFAGQAATFTDWQFLED